jgi:hypothetical protein
MENYKHFVSGFFAREEDLHVAVNKLSTLGITSRHIHIRQKPKMPPAHTTKADSNHTLDDMLVDSAVGAAVGTGVGIAAELALLSANVSLFVASPLIAPLVLLGWGTGLGGFLGVAVGASNKTKPFSQLVNDAIGHGQFILIIEATSERESAIARNIIKEAVGDFQEKS